MFTLQLIRFSLSFSLFCTIIPINFGHPYKFLRSKSQPIHMHCRGSNAVLFLFLHVVSKWRVTAWEMCLFLSCLSFRLTQVYVRKMLPPTSSDRARLHSLCSFASTEATHTCSRGTVAWSLITPSHLHNARRRNAFLAYSNYSSRCYRALYNNFYVNHLE